MSKKNKLIEILKGIAPTVALGLGSPLASGILKILLNKTGAKNENALIDIIGEADPATLKLIKEIEYNYKIQMKEFEIDLEELAYKDRDSARRREAAVGSLMPRLLAGIIYGSLLLLGGMIATGLTVKADLALLNLILGFLISEGKSISQYYYGSSSGSKHKTELMAGKS